MSTPAAAPMPMPAFAPELRLADEDPGSTPVVGLENCVDEVLAAAREDPADAFVREVEEDLLLELVAAEEGDEEVEDVEAEGAVPGQPTKPDSHVKLSPV
jgi:hypothetical protein